MTVGFSKIDGAEPLPPAAGKPRADGAGVTGGASFARDLEAASAPAPPPEVSAEVEAAARAAERLHEMGREIRFEQDPGGLRIELRDLAGNVLRSVPPAEVYDFAQGQVTD